MSAEQDRKSNLTIPASKERRVAETSASRGMKLTAIFYCSLPGVIAHVERHGTLPPKMAPAPWGGMAIPIIAKSRGLDPELTLVEQKVLNALLASDCPAGSAIMLNEP